MSNPPSSYKPSPYFSGIVYNPTDFINNSTTAVITYSQALALFLQKNTPITLSYSPSALTSTSSLGYLKTVTGSASVLTGATPYDVCNTGSLPAGVWLITANFTFPNITAFLTYYGWINTTTGTYTAAKGVVSIQQQVAGGLSELSTSYVYQTTSATTFYATTQINTSTGTVTGGIQAVRIG